MHKYYPGEPVNIHIHSLINIIHMNNRVITTKKRVRVIYHYIVVTDNGKFPYMLYNTGENIVVILHIYGARAIFKPFCVHQDTKSEQYVI